MDKIIVDIVIIGRNEGKLLEIAINSCKKAAEDFATLGHPMPKIIYVDSQSSDGSLDLAKRLGAECYTVESNPNPAAGRHVGFAHCMGKYVFFVDGDMEVCPGWLPAGISYLERHPEVAGVAGFCDWEIIEGEKVTKILNKNGIKRNGEKVSTEVGGGFIYRRDVLMEAGDFDPTMIRGGEFELYLRILAHGFYLAYLTIPMVIHRDLKGSMGRNFLRRSILTKNIFIPGVVARKAPRQRAAQIMLLRRYWLFLWHPLSLLFFVICAGFAMTQGLHSGWLIISAFILTQLFVAHWFYKKRNILRALVSLFTMNLYMPAFIIGYFTKWPKVGGYYTRHS